jgi:hypothetical protein
MGRRISTCAEVSVDAIAINAAAANNPTLIAYSRDSLYKSDVTSSTVVTIKPHLNSRACFDPSQTVRQGSARTGVDQERGKTGVIRKSPNNPPSVRGAERALVPEATKTEPSREVVVSGAQD